MEKQSINNIMPIMLKNFHAHVYIFVSTSKAHYSVQYTKIHPIGRWLSLRGSPIKLPEPDFSQSGGDPLGL